jgi:hypothetical protein
MVDIFEIHVSVPLDQSIVTTSDMSPFCLRLMQILADFIQLLTLGFWLKQRWINFWINETAFGWKWKD